MSTHPFILVTGGAGYIGSHVCKALYEKGFIPVTFDNFEAGHKWAVQWGPLLEGDIHNEVHVMEALESYKPLAVFHLAASTSVRESLVNPEKYYHNNVIGTLKLLTCMVKANVKKLIFSSTASIFGNPDYVPIDESHIHSPIHAYGKSKYMVELMLKDWERTYGLRSVCLRYFNACGADKSAVVGEAHYPETHLVPLVIQAALKQKTHIDIFGTQYQTKDGTAIRDYIHVSDLATAHLQALDWLIKNEASIQLNLGTGQGYSVKEVIQAVEKITGKSVDQSICPPSPDADRLIASPTLANEKLNWYPIHSSLENIIQTALLWHEKG